MTSALKLAQRIVGGEVACTTVEERLAQAVIDLTAALEEVRGQHAILREAVTNMVTMFEHSMFGAVNHAGMRWEVGKTDVQLVPDGSYMLSDARRALQATTTDAVLSKV